MQEQDFSNQLEKLEERIPYDSSPFDEMSEYYETLTHLLDDSESIALSDLYPFEDWSQKELPKRLYNWQLRACVEISNFLGKEGLLSYSENGLSYSKLKDGLSYDLQSEIIPNVGTISHTTNTQGTGENI